MPAGAELISQTGWTQPLGTGSVYGKTMFSGYEVVPNGKQATIQLHYITPPNVFSGSPSSYRLTIQHQPGSHPELFTVHAKDAAGGKIGSWNIPAPLEDFTAAMPIAPRPIHPLHLALTNVHPVVAPNHWIEPFAYLGKPTHFVGLAG